MTAPLVTLRVPETPATPGPPRSYATPAARQRAYRERCQEARRRELAAADLPGLPVLPTVPGYPRWRALIRQAHVLLGIAQAEMEAYYDQRSERWQEGERGETFLERMEALGEAHQAVADLAD